MFQGMKNSFWDLDAVVDLVDYPKPGYNDIWQENTVKMMKNYEKYTKTIRH